MDLSPFFVGATDLQTVRFLDDSALTSTWWVLPCLHTMPRAVLGLFRLRLAFCKAMMRACRIWIGARPVPEGDRGAGRAAEQGDRGAGPTIGELDRGSRSGLGAIGELVGQLSRAIGELDQGSRSGLGPDRGARPRFQIWVRGDRGAGRAADRGDRGAGPRFQIYIGGADHEQNPGADSRSPAVLQAEKSVREQRSEFIAIHRAMGHPLSRCAQLWAQQPDVLARKTRKEEKSKKKRERRGINILLVTFLSCQHESDCGLLFDCCSAHGFVYLQSIGSMKRRAGIDFHDCLPDPWQSDLKELALPDPWGDATELTGQQASRSQSSQASRPSGRQPRTKISLGSGARLLSSATLKEKQNKFERAGSDVEQIKKRRLEPCPRKNCTLDGCKPGAIPLNDLKSLCQCFWSITAEERSHLLQSTFGENCSNEKIAQQKEYYIGSARVCFTNFCKKLATSAPTIRKYFAGQPDQRLKHGKAMKSSYAKETALATQACNNFFQELHQSAAEALPEDENCARSKKSSALSEDLASPWEEDGCYDWHGGDPLTVACLAQVLGLPVRYIQHSRMSDLYWQFWSEWQVLAEWGHGALGKCPSYDTFRRAYKKNWKSVLQMRTSSQHSQCQLCFDFQALLRSPTVSFVEKAEAARAYRTHLADQYKDRCLYWSLRFAARYRSNVLTIIIDDMDHSKFYWPHFGWNKNPHELDNIVRPCVTFTGALVHGWNVHLFMTHPQVPGGSDFFCEILSQCIQSVFQACSPSRPAPENLVVVADNTVKSAKNQHVLKFLSRIVALGHFRSACLFNLMVGHTHEDIDQLFSVVLAVLKRKKSWQTPQELLEYISSCFLAASCAQAEHKR
eukprot:s1605_g5.t1